MTKCSPEAPVERASLESRPSKRETGRVAVRPEAVLVLTMIFVFVLTSGMAIALTRSSAVDEAASRPPPPPPQALAIQKEYPSIYFTKTPKAGGTTFALMLERYASDANGSVYYPPMSRWGAQTCRKYADDQSAFAQLKSTNDRTNPRVFLSQACLNPSSKFVRSFDLRVGIVRSPMRRHQSAYEYLKRRCLKNDPKLPKYGECGPALKSFNEYTLRACSRAYSDACSYQAKYLHSARAHDFLIITERFEESMVALHMLNPEIPLYAFLHLNHNPDDPQTLLELDEKARRAARKGLKSDFRIYRQANLRLNDLIDNELDPVVFHTLLNALIAANLSAKDNCRVGVMDPPSFGCLNREFPTIFKGSAACFVDCVSKFDVVPLLDDNEYEYENPNLPVIDYDGVPRLPQESEP